MTWEMPLCPRCGREMAPMVGDAYGRPLRFLWWACRDCCVCSAAVPVPDVGIPPREGSPTFLPGPPTLLD